jgi:two-component system response regulator HydG
MTKPEARAPRRARVVVVDDKLAMAETLADGLVDRGFDAGAEANAPAAIEAARTGRVDVIVTDLRMPGVDGLELVEAVRAAKLDVPVIVMTAYGAIDSAVESIRRGAYHYLTKPFKLDELAIFVQRALDERALRREAAELRRSLAEHFSVAGVIAESAAMQRVLNVVERVAPSNVAVLIHGETGAGKGLVARVLHGASRRADKPFVAINCAALPEALLESELFGHVMGAFTGATGHHDGLFAGADGGSVLLDEIGEIPIGLQAKLLRVLEAGRVRPVGAVRERTVDVRILAATHRDLRRAVAEGTFREDLLYRLDVVSIDVPPLRQRRDDIAPLVESFLAKARERHPGSRVERVSRGALQRLLDYSWPGNVRELEHAIERGVLLAADTEIQDSDLGLAAAQLDSRSTFSGEVVPMIEMQRRYARWALDELGGHKTRTAERLDVDIKTLNRWLNPDVATEGKSDAE